MLIYVKIKSSLPRQFAGGEGVLICSFKETLRCH